MKIAASIIVAFLLALLIAGCSTGESSNTPSPETPSSTDLPPSEYLPEIPRIGVDQVKAKLDGGANILIIDSRSKEDYNESHIVGAISIPLDDIAQHYDELEGYEKIITYCD